MDSAQRCGISSGPLRSFRANFVQLTFGCEGEVVGFEYFVSLHCNAVGC